MSDELLDQERLKPTGQMPIRGLAAQKKKRARPAPTMELSMEYLRKQGCRPWPVERFISQPSPHNVDLYNCFDLMYVHLQESPYPHSRIPFNPEAMPEIGFVQTTTWAQRKARALKMKEQLDIVWAIARIPNVHVDLHTWRKVEGEWTLQMYRVEAEASTGRVLFMPYKGPTLKEVRAAFRIKEKAEEEANRRTVRRL